MLASPIRPGKAYRVKHNGRSIDVLAPTGADAILAVLNMQEGFTQGTVNADLLGELEVAHQIILNALALMTSEQKAEWGKKNAADGVDGEGITRFHERATVIAVAKGL